MSRASDPSAIAWHALGVAETRAALRSDATGLTAAEAAARLARSGANVIPTHEGHGVWNTLAHQFRGTLVLLLVVAAAVALLTNELLDAVAIAIVLLLNATLGFATEFQAHRAVRALRDLDPRRALVVRDAEPVEIDASAVVPGDVMLLEAGVVVAADGRVTDAFELSADESLLTGESLPVHKAVGALGAATPVAERRNLVYAGTMVTGGGGRAVVTSTGAATELGNIGRLVGAVQPPRPPIERRLERLGRVLALAAGAIILVLAVLGAVRGMHVLELLETSVALAVAAIPEALPAVATVSLAIGAVRMSRRNVIVRRLAAIESLGATTTVCVDKTGTLTTGRMAVTQLVAPGWTWNARGSAPADARLPRVLRIGALASPAANASEGNGALSREATDVAFIAAAEQAGVRLGAEAVNHALPFDSHRMYAAAFTTSPDGAQAFVKGAPHIVLDRCDRMATGDGSAKLSDTLRAEIARLNDALAANGLRVLALAEGHVRRPDDASLRGLTFHCLAALSDPVVPGAPEAIDVLRQASVRVIMLTGDQVRTATAIGRQLGLGDGLSTTLDAGDVSRLGGSALRERLARAHVVARVTPEEKLRVVETLQDAGEVVGVFGDGVNDAPALRRADVGVAMGLRGSDVAKESAEIVLRDDRLDSLRDAIYEGRVIFDNIRKAVTYLLACNAAELLFLLVASLAGAPLLFTPLQLLWINLVTDTFPALALSLEPGDPEIMRRAPRSPRAPLVGARDWRDVGVHGGLMAAAALGAWLTVSRLAGADVARSAGFATIALTQLLHLQTVRGRRRAPRWLHAGRWAIAATLASAALLGIVFWVDPLARVMRTTSLSMGQWAIVAGFGVLPLVVSGAMASSRRADWRRSTRPG